MGKSREEKKQINVDVPPHVQHWLEEAKKDGYSKSSVIEDAVTLWRFLFYSTEDWETTKPEVMIYRSLKRMREHFASQGADQMLLIGLDAAIRHQKDMLLKLETGQFKKVDSTDIKKGDK